MMDLPHAVLWLIAGLVLMLAEVVVPGAFLMWLGLAALGTGLVVQVAEPSFAWQVVVFAMFAAISIAVGLRVRSPRKAALINTPASGLVGREVVVLEIHGRTARVRLSDSDWSARLASGAEAPEPQAVLKVVDVDGTTLVVGPA